MAETSTEKCTGPFADYCPVHPRGARPRPSSPPLDEIARELCVAVNEWEANDGGIVAPLWPVLADILQRHFGGKV